MIHSLDQLVFKARVPPTSLHLRVVSPPKLFLIHQSVTMPQGLSDLARVIGQTRTTAAIVQDGMVDGAKCLLNRPLGIITTRAISPTPSRYASYPVLMREAGSVGSRVRVFLLLRQGVTQQHMLSDPHFGYLGNAELFVDIVRDGVLVVGSAVCMMSMKTRTRRTDLQPRLVHCITFFLSLSLSLSFPTLCAHGLAIALPPGRRSLVSTSPVELRFSPRARASK